MSKNSMHKKGRKGQAALEFLSTYGWAFLVLLILVVGMAYLGVLEPSSYIPTNCQSTPGINCVESQLGQNGAYLRFLNSGEAFVFLNESAYVTSLNRVSGCSHPVIDIPSELIQSQSNFLIRITNCSLPVHSQQNIFLGVDYVVVGKSLVRSMTVDLSGVVSSAIYASALGGLEEGTQTLPTIYNHTVVDPQTGLPTTIYSLSPTIDENSQIWLDSAMTQPYVGDFILIDDNLYRVLPDGSLCPGGCGVVINSQSIDQGGDVAVVYFIGQFVPGTVLFLDSELTQLMNGLSFMYQGQYYQTDDYGRVCTENWYCGVSYGLEVSVFKIEDGFYNMPAYVYASTQELALGMRIYVDETFTYTYLYENSVLRFAGRYYHLNEESVITLISTDNPYPNIQEVVTYYDCIGYKLNINSFVVLKIGNSYYSESFELLENVQIFTPQSCPCHLTYVYQDCSGGNIFPVYAIAGEYQNLIFTDASCSQIATTLSYGTNEFASRGVINGYYSPLNSFSISSLGVASVQYSCLDLGGDDTDGGGDEDNHDDSGGDGSGDDYFDGFTDVYDIEAYSDCDELYPLDLYTGRDYHYNYYIFDASWNLYNGQLIQSGAIYDVYDGIENFFEYCS
jgi:hypothetical protein